MIFHNGLNLCAMAGIASQLGARADQDEVLVAGVVELLKMLGGYDHHLTRVNYILGVIRIMECVFSLGAMGRHDEGIQGFLVGLSICLRVCPT
jgi:hypothetical protein